MKVPAMADGRLPRAPPRERVEDEGKEWTAARPPRHVSADPPARADSASRPGNGRPGFCTGPPAARPAGGVRVSRAAAGPPRGIDGRPWRQRVAAAGRCGPARGIGRALRLSESPSPRSWPGARARCRLRSSCRRKGKGASARRTSI